MSTAVIHLSSVIERPLPLTSTALGSNCESEGRKSRGLSSGRRLTGVEAGERLGNGGPSLGGTVAETDLLKVDSRFEAIIRAEACPPCDKNG